MSSVNAGNPIKPGQTVVAVVTNASFTGAAVATLRSGALTQAQAKSFVDGTHFTIDVVVQGSLPFGAITLRVTEGATTEDIAVTLNPVTDNAYTDISGALNTTASIFYNYAPYATILQVEYTEADLVYEIIDPTASSQNVTIYPDGTIRVQRNTNTFTIRLWDGTAWSSFATFTLNSFDDTALPSFPDYEKSSSYPRLFHKFVLSHPYKYKREIYSQPNIAQPVNGLGLPSLPGSTVAALYRDPEMHRFVSLNVPNSEFYTKNRDSLTIKLFDIAQLRDGKQQAQTAINRAMEQGNVTRLEYKLKIEPAYTLDDDNVVAGRSNRDHWLYAGETFNAEETSLGQTTAIGNFVELSPTARLQLYVVNNQYVMQPVIGNEPIRDFTKWPKFNQNEWVGVIIITRWSRYHGGYQCIYINGQKVYAGSGGTLPTSASTSYKIGLTANPLALSRRTVSFKDATLSVA